jgi:Response regulators consisting of a CheY-like receiver domain and a winged-helix DNA-binding domain
MRILLVEDDKNLCDSLAFQLEKEGFTVDTCHDGEDSLYWISQNAHELILLDRMLPGFNGIQVLEKMRKNNNHTPVILVTALGELNDKIKGLDTGADDYIVKPFAFEELMARIRSIRRRPTRLEDIQSLSYADITLNPLEKQLQGPKNNCSLSKRETDLFEIFLKNPDQTLPRMMLLARVWGPDAEVEEGNLDNYIHFLRKRLKVVHSETTIKTVRGIGYKLEVKHV